MIRGRGALLLAAIVLGGCGGGSEDAPFSPEAVDEADAFMRALVADGDPHAASSHAIGDAARNLYLWHDYLMRDGIQTVEGPGSQRLNCMKPFPVYATAESASCIVYRLRGLAPIPRSDKTLVTTARFRVWLQRDDGRWRVADFDYSPRLEAR